MKVRLTSSRAGAGRGWKPGEMVDLPDAQAQRLLDAGEAEPYIDGSPTWIPPAEWKGTQVVIHPGVAAAAASPASDTPAPAPATPPTTPPAAEIPPPRTRPIVRRPGAAAAD